MSASEYCNEPHAGWEKVELSSCFELQNGINFSSDQRGKGLLVLDVLNMFSDDLYVRTNQLYRVDIKVAEDRLLRPGDILFVRSSVKESGVGWPAIFKGHDEPVTNCGFLIRARQTSPKLEPRFLVHYLRQNSIRAQMISRAGKVAITNINQERLGSLKIPLPPLVEQKRIADILDRAEALRAKRQAALAQLDELTQSIFIDMFGDPVKNSMGWSVINLEDICSIITDGEHATPKRTESGIYLLSARNIQNHSLSLDDVDFIDKDEYNRISKRIIPQKGDILVSCSGTIGRVAQVKECFKFQLVRSVALLRPETSKVNPTYLEYNFDSIYLKKQIEKSVNQSSQANLFQGKIRKLKIPLPPLEIQDKFAEVAGQLEKIKQSHQQSLLEINNLFDSLTHEAFTGKLTSNQSPERQMGNGVAI